MVRNDKTQMKVNAKEIEDRMIAEKVMKQLETDEFVHWFTVSGMTVDCSYDIEGVDNFPFEPVPYVAEIKQNTTNPRFKVKAIIKKKKVEDIFKEAKNKQIYFISLLDHRTAYIFNMRAIDWNSTEIINMRQKKRQLESDKDKVEYYTVPTYLISYDKAFYSCPIDNFYKELENNAIYSEEAKETYLPS